MYVMVQVLSICTFCMQWRSQVFGRKAFTTQKIKFPIKDFFSKCDQIRRSLWIWSHLLKKSLMENFIFCIVFSYAPCTILRKSCNLKLICANVNEL